jgi:hypothetical protein
MDFILFLDAQVAKRCMRGEASLRYGVGTPRKFTCSGTKMEMLWIRHNKDAFRRSVTRIGIGAMLLVSPWTSSGPLPPVATVRDLPSDPAAIPKSKKAFSCPEAPIEGTLLLNFPEQPASDRPVTLVALVPQQAVKTRIELKNEKGRTLKPQRFEEFGSGQKAVSASFSSLPAGRYTAAILSSTEKTAMSCKAFVVEHQASSNPAPSTSVWQVRRDWDPSMEALYSAWIAKLFYVSPGAHKGWKPLHQATRDPTRNFLYGSLGFDEDNARSAQPVRLAPDCADLPFHLRAYFSWKLGLPILINQCNRGRSDTGSRCTDTLDNTTTRFDSIENIVERFNVFIERVLTWKVHTGNLRTAPGQVLSDTYAVSLSAAALQPGAVFVDPGGHALVISQVEPQTRSRLGTLYGVDAHPDRTITQKAFSLGTFIFNYRVPTGGFKGFRPVVRDGKGGLRFLSNKEIDAEPGFAPRSKIDLPFSSNDNFYDEVFVLLNPRPPDPRDVLAAKIEVLHGAILDRVLAVQLGVDYMKTQGSQTMDMPRGAQIFETVGPWEDYSTPARDLRCLLAIDDVLGFPESAAANLGRYKVSARQTPAFIQSELTSLRDDLLAKTTIEYQRSDGSKWTLSLAQVIARQRELEIAYNPNDCPELRWGAPEGSQELSTCNRYAPKEQRSRMNTTRAWFANRTRPGMR